MDSPELAISFIEKAKAKYEIIYGTVEKKDWTDAKMRANLALNSRLASMPTRQVTRSRNPQNNQGRSLGLFRRKKAPQS